MIDVHQIDYGFSGPNVPRRGDIVAEVNPIFNFQKVQYFQKI